MAEEEVMYNSREGWLAKTGSNNKGWRDRYFKLFDGRLHYYKSEKESGSLGHIDLRECLDITKSAGKKGFGIDINMPGRVYNLSMKSEDDLDQWFASLSVSHSIASKQPKPAVSSVRTTSVSSVAGKFNSLPSSGRVGRNNSIGQDDPSPQTKRKSDIVDSLLEAEVDAFRVKVDQLESDLTASEEQKATLQAKLEERELEYKQLKKQYENQLVALRSQIRTLEQSKAQLETVNDSLAAQVEGNKDLITELQEDSEEANSLREEIIASKERQQELEEDLKELEEENDNIKNSLSLETKKCLQLDKELKHYMKVVQNLEVLEKERDRLKHEVDQKNVSPDESNLKEERLKLQLELENLRNSTSEQLKLDKETRDKEMQQLMCQVEESQQRETSLKHTIEEKDEKLKELNEQVGTMDSRIASLEEKCKLLQVEKDKAVSDLIQMRKSRKERERKSLVDVDGQNNTDGALSKLAEAEGRAEMATRLLQEIQVERDSLRVQLRKHSLTPEPSAAEGPSQNHMPLFVASKAQPTTAVTYSDVTMPPPKPKRPPKEVLNQKLKL